MNTYAYLITTVSLGTMTKDEKEYIEGIWDVQTFRDNKDLIEEYNEDNDHCKIVYKKFCLNKYKIEGMKKKKAVVKQVKEENIIKDLVSEYDEKFDAIHHYKKYRLEDNDSLILDEKLYTTPIYKTKDKDNKIYGYKIVESSELSKYINGNTVYVGTGWENLGQYKDTDRHVIAIKLEQIYKYSNDNMKKSYKYIFDYFKIDMDNLHYRPYDYIVGVFKTMFGSEINFDGSKMLAYRVVQNSKPSNLLLYDAHTRTYAQDNFGKKHNIVLNELDEYLEWGWELVGQYKDKDLYLVSIKDKRIKDEWVRDNKYKSNAKWYDHIENYDEAYYDCYPGHEATFGF